MASYISLSSAAVIGAGISGVAAAAHLKKQGIEVTVFERNYASGGVWLFDERLPPEPYFPSVKPSVAEQSILGSDASLIHAPPGPCYSSLMNNISTGLLETSLLSWPEGTPPNVKHHVLRDYIQNLSKTTGVHDVTRYNTRVKEVRKIGEKWNITTQTLASTGKAVESQDTFDAIVVASGHYHAPRIPALPGLKEWKDHWPARISHSKSYRFPEPYRGKNVLIIGAGVSALDIARDIAPGANQIWQASRGGDFDLPASVLPENAARVPYIESFEYSPEDNIHKTLGDDEPIPFKVKLVSGHKLCDIHYVIIATGYHISLPFLSELHQDDVSPEDVDEKAIVSDGTMYHNLHKDIFYIPDPTLSFIGVPYYTATFSLFEFQAKLLALVYSGQVSIPSTEALREEYKKRALEKGIGRHFNSLKGQEEDYVLELADWANQDLVQKGKPPFSVHTDSWRAEKDVQRARLEKIFGVGILDLGKKDDTPAVTVLDSITC